MATLTPTAFAANSSTGAAIGFAASSSNGDNFLNTGAQVLLCQNSSSQGAGSTVTVTVTAQSPDNFGGAASLHTITIPVGSSSMGVTALGPFSPRIFNDSSGLVQFTYSAAGLWVKAVSIAPQS